MGEFSFGEMIVIAIIAIVIYGKELPHAARKLASLYTKLRRQVSDIKDELQRQIPPEDIKLNLESIAAEAPSVPTGLYAGRSGERILLTWNSSVGATTYTIKRASSEGAPHYVLSSGLAELSYYDTDVQPGVTYSYVICAANSAGESADSEPVSLLMEAEAVDPPAAAETPAAAPPAPETAPAPEPSAPPPPAAESAPGGNGHTAETKPDETSIPPGGNDVRT